MNLIKLWKNYSDGEVRSLDVTNTDDNVKHMLSNGFFLTEDEAKTGKVKPIAKEEIAIAKPVAKKPIKIIKK